jgi:hypothetical protein
MQDQRGQVTESWAAQADGPSAGTQALCAGVFQLPKGSQKPGPFFFFFFFNEKIFDN